MNWYFKYLSPPRFARGADKESIHTWIPACYLTLFTFQKPIVVRQLDHVHNTAVFLSSLVLLITECQ